jgi:hypothetical protein
MKQMQELRNYVKTKGKSGDQHGDGFLKLLDETGAYLGPYSIKMAQDYLKNLETSKKT